MAQSNGSGRIKEGILPRVRYEALPVNPGGTGKRSLSQWLADSTLMIPAIAADTATIQNIVLGNTFGEIDWGKGFAESAALVEKFHALSVDDLVDQAMLSVNSAAQEIGGGNLKEVQLHPHSIYMQLNWLFLKEV